LLNLALNKDNVPLRADVCNTLSLSRLILGFDDFEYDSTVSRI